jgi:hypothetical protein
MTFLCMVDDTVLSQLEELAFILGLKERSL